MKNAFLFASILLLIGASAFGYDWSTNPGDGSEDTPYQISTAEQMNAIGGDTTLWDKHFKLAADIDMANLGETYYNVIGNDTDHFTGVFDGNGKVIENLTIHQPYTNFIGMFGYTGEGSEIKNLELKGINVAGNQRCGGLVGFNCGAITACKISGTFTNNESESGGLAGFNSDTGTILNCCSAVDITTSRSCVGCLAGVNGGAVINSCSTGTLSGSPSYSRHIGGLIGNNLPNGTVTGCYSTGEVTGDEYVGGLVGTNWGTIENCYATGGVHQAVINGGLVGRNRKTGIVKYCYSTGQIDYSGTQGGLIGYSYYNDIGTVINCFWDRDTSGCSRSCGGGAGLPTSVMKQMYVYSLSGWGESVWTLDEGNDYPRLAWENTGDPLIVNDTFSFAGAGTDEDPYQINTFEDLQLLSVFDAYWDKHFILTADIDLDGLQILRIGNGSLGFTGTFDGGGHVISNLTLNLPNGEYVGLFGFINVLGSVKNLELANLKVAGRKCVGGLAGLIKDSCKIINCKVTGEVTGVHWVGGLVGRADGRNMIINNCSVKGTVKGEEPVGGLLGDIDGYKSHIEDCHAEVDVQGTANYAGGLIGEIEPGQLHLLRCFSSGSVEGKSFVGGLAGKVDGSHHINFCYSKCRVNANVTAGGLIGRNEGALLKYSYATGAVTAEVRGGGLIGWNENWNDSLKVKHCYSTGAVNSSDDAIMIGGMIGSGEPIENSFWDVDTSGMSSGVGGTGLPTDLMKNKSSFIDAGWDFDDVWYMPVDDYPRLRMVGPLFSVSPEWSVVSKKRVGRSSYDYECRVDVENISGADLYDVSLELVDGSGQLVIGDPDVSFGDISYGQTVKSTDTFTITIDRNNIAQLDSLYWKISFSETQGAPSETQSMTVAAGYSLVDCDFDGSGVIDVGDLRTLASQWLESGRCDITGGDGEPDGIVNLLDLAAFLKELN